VNDIEYDVAIAAYLIADLAQADFDTLLQHVAQKEVAVEGVALVAVDADGTVAVQENGDHLGRRGVELGGGVGLVVGLFAPPLLAAAAIGAAAGGLVAKFAQHKVSSGIGDKLGDALPPGSAGILVIYDRAKTELVTACLVSSVRTSTAEIDGGRVKDLKAALADAQMGMGG
jgi:uncharacterized membrane protein